MKHVSFSNQPIIGGDSMMNEQWWKDAVVYQIYPKSFCDTDGDGIGDLKGIIRKLDYLETLGVDVLWICPMYKSPMDDNGYDISDYYKVAEEFGTNDDMEELMKQAKQKGMRVLLDLVVNHCSDEHPWFLEAVRNPQSEEAGYFYFADPENGEMPNNWRSNFGGPAWSRIEDGRYYLHTFGRKQPDLNWENPLLREKIYEMINWWIDKGVDGFRVDAITFIKKDTTFKSGPAQDADGRYRIENFTNYPGIGDFLSEMKAKTFAVHNCMTVAEAPGVPYDQLADYAGDEGYFSMIFEFSYADMNQHNEGWSFEGFRDALYKSQEESMKAGWYGVFLENHDHPRSANKYIPEAMLEKFGDKPKTMLATLYFLLRGTPFIYQGQEIGMVNFPFESIEQFRDISAHNAYGEMLQKGVTPKAALETLKHISRDNGRTPMQWDDSESAGFTTGKPWIDVHPGFRTSNVMEQSTRGDSILAYYKKLIALRKDSRLHDVWVQGDFRKASLEVEGVIAYKRSSSKGTIHVYCNFTGEEQVCQLEQKPVSILLSNYEETAFLRKTLVLAPYQAVVFL